MSEAELHLLKARLRDGIQSKAQRGELDAAPRNRAQSLDAASEDRALCGDAP